MHRHVNPTCVNSTVLYNATSHDIAALVGVRPEAIETTQSVVSGEGRVAVIAARRGGKCNTKEDGRMCGGLDRGTFADLFVSGMSMDGQMIAFGEELARRLQGLKSSKRGNYGLGLRRRNVPMDVSAEVSSESSSSAGMMDSSGSSSATERNGCGFSERGAHVDVEVLCGGFAICKTGGGLYRTARSVSMMQSGGYFEVVVVEDCGVGGICIGVSTERLGLNKLVGSDGTSIGLHSSGLVVRGDGEFREFGKAFKNGDRVGCLLRRGEQAMCERGVELEYWINGEWQGCVREDLGAQVECGHWPLFAAISLYRKGSKAVIQCCKKDWTKWRHIENRGQAHAICEHKWSRGNSWQ